ncbi:hydrolase 76 protein [Blyttiomyces sp. JEL0837]|nr:hydrolase 76 protein [Blyttiomyces sp. JEL0837]
MKVPSILSAIVSVLAAAGITSVSASQDVTALTSQAGALTAAKAAAKWMPYYFQSFEFPGAWSQGLVQWHESGVYWNILINYRQLTGDTTYDNFINSNMILASHADQGDFLDSANGIDGKWNDDIGWWALAAITGAETYGKDTKIYDPQGQLQGATWFAVADKTWNHMLEQWDETHCKGGIYWSRNRQSTVERERIYKSAISNAEAIHLAARMYKITKIENYKTWADKIYAWMKNTLIMTDYTVYDGVYAAEDGTCQVEQLVWTYHPAELIAGLVTFYQATGTQSYLDEAKNLYKAIQQNFVNPSTGGFWDPTCVQNGGISKCKDPSGYMWPLYHALAVLYRETNDAGIYNFMGKTAQPWLQQCGADWNCIRTLNPAPTSYAFPNGTNPRDQFEIMEIVNAFLFMDGAVQVSAVPTPGNNGGGSKSSATMVFERMIPTVVLGALGVAVGLVGVLVF